MSQGTSIINVESFLDSYWTFINLNLCKYNFNYNTITEIILIKINKIGKHVFHKLN